MKKIAIALCALALTSTINAQTQELILKPAKPAEKESQPEPAKPTPAAAQPPSKGLLPDEKVLSQRKAGTSGAVTSPEVSREPEKLDGGSKVIASRDQSDQPDESDESEDSDSEEGSESSSKRDNKKPAREPPPVITPKDLLVDQKGIPESPAWLKELQRQDVQHLFEKRALERESDLVKIRATIAESEASIRKSKSDDKAKDAPKTAAIAGQFFGQQPLPQYISDAPPGVQLTGAQRAQMPPPPPPPPSPPTVARIMGDFAVLNYDANQYTVKVGETIPGGYSVKGISFDTVTILNSTGAEIRVSPQW